MVQQRTQKRFRTPGNRDGLAQGDNFYKEEVQLALRNSGMPLEGLRYPITPTGMHYLLTHFDIPYVDTVTWRLKVGGLVSNPLTLSLDDIKERPISTLTVTMECAGNGRALLMPRAVSQPWLLEAIGTVEWTGTPLREILHDAGTKEDAAEALFTGIDKGIQGEETQYYQRSLTIEEATHPDTLLAYEMNGAPLQPQHGYPLRLIAPGWYGMASVKWLDRIEVIQQPFQGYQVTKTYRYSQSADDPGEPVTTIKVRALMIPPGIPDFVTRTRLVEAGLLTLRGRAWAGLLEVSRVEVSTDGGATWPEAQLAEPVSTYAWRGWSFQWQAIPGKHILSVRATDSEGNTQPIEQPWNFQGMGNNMAQRVEVIVE